MNVKKYRSTKRPSRKPRNKGNRRGGRFGNPRSLAPVKGNYARSVESVIYEDIMPNQGIIQLTQLSDFPRTQVLSGQFQWYRITEVKYTYEPFSDTYQEALPSSSAYASVPQMYSIMDRSGFYTNLTTGTAFTLGTIVEQGAKPRKFTKNLTIKYRPNTLVNTATNGSDGSILSTSPELRFGEWMSTYTLTDGGATNPSLVPYYGHVVWFDQESGTAAIGRLTVSVTVEFKQPLAIGTLGSSAQSVVRLKPASTVTPAQVTT